MKFYQDQISFNKDVRSGQACIINTRITVADILSYLASGMSNTEILEDFPELSNQDILSALAFAAESQKRTSGFFSLNNIIFKYRTPIIF